jgi:GTP-binding protein
MRAESAVKRSDIILFVVEADQFGVTAQDKIIAKIIEDSGKGCILIANKWDLCRDDMTEEEAENELRYSLKFLKYAPIVFTSAIESYNFDKIIEHIIGVKDRMDMRIPTPFLNKIINDAYKKTPPPIIGRKIFKIYYSTMTRTAPPEIVMFVNNSKICSKNYLTYLNNILRKNLDFTGWPIRLSMKNRPQSKERK